MQEKDFISYEYKTVCVKATDSVKAMDMYEAFGWEITGSTASAIGGVTLSLKRDRKQRHKQELNKLERQAEETMDTLNGLQKSKTMGASVFAYIFGVVATLILGGGMSLVMLLTNNVYALTGGIALGVIGLAMCGVNYYIYSKIAAKKIKQVLPEIDRTEEKLANILEKGNDLLKTELI